MACPRQSFTPPRFAPELWVVLFGLCSITLSQHAILYPLPSIAFTSCVLMCKSGATDPSHTYLDVSLADGPVGISSSPGQDLPAISAVIATALQKELASYASYGAQAAVKEGVQAAVAWNFIYTPCEGPILPVRWVHDHALVIVSFFHLFESKHTLVLSDRLSVYFIV